MTTANPALTRRQLDRQLARSPVHVFIDGVSFKILSPVKGSRLYIGTFIEGPQAGILMSIDVATNEMSPVDKDANLRPRYPSRLALADFVSYLVRATLATGQRCSTLSDEIAKTLCGAGVTAAVTCEQLPTVASPETIAEIFKEIDLIWVEAVAWSPRMTLQVSLAMLANKLM